MSESVVQFNRVFAEVNRSQCRYRLLCGGAGGRSLEKYGNWVNQSGAGGDGIVIIYGIPV